MNEKRTRHRFGFSYTLCISILFLLGIYIIIKIFINSLLSKDYIYVIALKSMISTKKIIPSNVFEDYKNFAKIMDLATLLLAW